MLNFSKMYTKQNGVNGRRPIAARSRTKSLGNGPNGKQTAHKQQYVNGPLWTQQFHKQPNFNGPYRKSTQTAWSKRSPTDRKKSQTAKIQGWEFDHRFFARFARFFGIERAKDWFDCEKSESLLLPFLKIDGINACNSIPLIFF